MNDQKYWEDFYEKGAVPDIPSQFAVFVANEINSSPLVIDFGCGNGRDSLFFLNQGLRVIGLDSSESAILSCNEKIKDRFRGRASFLQAAIGGVDVGMLLNDEIKKNNNVTQLLIYSRFFVHALDEEGELNLMKLIARLIKDWGGVVALEFRTKRDESLPKSTGIHYRRFVDPVQFFSRVEKEGFKVEYFVEGFGFAKYKKDDAHVARFMLRYDSSDNAK